MYRNQGSAFCELKPLENLLSKIVQKLDKYIRLSNTDTDIKVNMIPYIKVFLPIPIVNQIIKLLNM